MLAPRIDEVGTPEGLALGLIRTLADADPEEAALLRLRLCTIVSAAYSGQLIPDEANEYVREVALALDRFCFTLWASLRSEP